MPYNFDALRTSVELDESTAELIVYALIGVGSFAVTADSDKQGYVWVHLSDTAVNRLNEEGLLVITPVEAALDKED